MIPGSELQYEALFTHRGKEGQFTAWLCWNSVLKVEGVMMDDSSTGFNDHVAYSSSSRCFWGRKLCSNSLHPLGRREIMWEGNKQGGNTEEQKQKWRGRNHGGLERWHEKDGERKKGRGEKIVKGEKGCGAKKWRKVKGVAIRNSH